MKKVLPSLLLGVSFLCCIIAKAQTGWKWGKSAKNFRHISEGIWPTVTDNTGSVYAAFQNNNDTVSIGTFTLAPPFFGGTVLTKADSSGNFLWATALIDVNIGFAADHYGNLYVSGSSGDLLKYDASGTLLWTKTAITGAEPYSVGCDNAGNIYVGGRLRDDSAKVGTITLMNTKPSGPIYDCFVAKYDSSGHPIWAKKFTGNAHELFGGFCVTGAGNVYVSGTSEADTVKIGSIKLPGDPPNPIGLGFKVTFIAKYDNSGNVTWAEKLSNRISVPAGLATDDAENLYLVSSYDTVITVGTQVLPRAAAGPGALIARYDAAGHFLWAKSSGGNSYAKGYQVSVDLCGHVWVCGQVTSSVSYPLASSDTLNFDGHITVDSTQEGYEPLFMVEFDTAGNYQTCLTLATAGDDACGFAVDNRGNFFISGDYPTDGTKLYLGRDTIADNMPTAVENFFVAKYKYDLTLCPSELSAPEVTATLRGINIYPNPAKDYIQISGAEKTDVLKLVTLYGQEVYSTTINQPIIDLPARLANGLYYAIVISPKGNAYQKLVVNR